MQQGVSPAAEAALKGIAQLSMSDKAWILQALAGELASAANSASPATGTKMDTGLSAELASATSIKTATHEFSIVTAADGKPAVQFNKKRDDGTTESFQLCEGARGTEYGYLAEYGKDKLRGATLKSHSEFIEMVDALLEAVKGLKVEGNRELQTEDQALERAFQIVQEGVRRQDCYSWVEFLTEDKEGGRAVSGRRVGVGHYWDGYDFRSYCAFFGVSSPESK